MYTPLKTSINDKPCAFRPLLIDLVLFQYLFFLKSWFTAAQHYLK